MKHDVTVDSAPSWKPLHTRPNSTWLMIVVGRGLEGPRIARCSAPLTPTRARPVDARWPHYGSRPAAEVNARRSRHRRRYGLVPCASPGRGRARAHRKRPSWPARGPWPPLGGWVPIGTAPDDQDGGLERILPTARPDLRKVPIMGRQVPAARGTAGGRMPRAAPEAPP